MCKISLDLEIGVDYSRAINPEYADDDPTFAKRL